MLITSLYYKDKPQLYGGNITIPTDPELVIPELS